MRRDIGDLRIRDLLVYTRTNSGFFAICLKVAFLVGLASQASGQWTVTYLYNAQDAATAFGGQIRLASLAAAIQRAKDKLEAVLAASTGDVQITLDLQNQPPATNAVADEVDSRVYVQTVTVARNKLMAKAAADGETAAEIAFYENVPLTGVRFFWDTATQQTATSIYISSALNKHLAFGGQVGTNDGTIRFKHASSTLKWQLFPGPPLNNTEVFEAVLIHETLHALGPV